MPDLRHAQTISVVMVTLNEEAAIAKVVADIRTVVPGAEVVVVDSSGDATAEIAAAAGCRVIRQVPPRGYGPALAEGLRSAQGEIVVTLDCDGTYPVEAIPQMVAALDGGLDMVNGSRLQHKPAAMPIGNYLANVAFAFLARALCSVHTSDVHSGMRAYRKSLLAAFAYDPDGMALPVELLVGPVQSGYRVGELFIDYRPRIGESTLRPLPGTLWTLRRLWKWRRRPQARTLEGERR